jgi:hypothetical protein
MKVNYRLKSTQNVGHMNAREFIGVYEIAGHKAGDTCTIEAPTHPVILAAFGAPNDVEPGAKAVMFTLDQDSEWPIEVVLLFTINKE